MPAPAASQSGTIASPRSSTRRCSTARPSVRIVDAGARPGRVGGDDDEAAVDLLPPVHPRGILLADIAALGEADAVQLGRIAFEPESLVRAELGDAFGDAERQAVREPALGRLAGGREPAAAERGQARIGRLAVRRPVDREASSRAIAIGAAQAVERRAAAPARPPGSASQSISTSAPSAQRMKSNRALPCAVSSPAQSGRSGASASMSLVTRPCRKPRTSSPERRSRARSVKVVPVMGSLIGSAGDRSNPPHPSAAPTTGTSTCATARCWRRSRPTPRGSSRARS